MILIATGLSVPRTKPISTAVFFAFIDLSLAKSWVITEVLNTSSVEARFPSDIAVVTRLPC